MMAPVFGDFLDAASGHIAAAVAMPGELTAEARCGVVRELDRVVSTLARYLGDLPLPDYFVRGTTSGLTAEARAALDARIAVRRAAQGLRPGVQAVRHISTEEDHPTVKHLSAAAGCLGAGRDLLQTHCTSPPGRLGPDSAWARALASWPVTDALVAEIGRLAVQLAPWVTRISLEGPADPAAPAMAGLALHSAGRWLWIAGAKLEAMSRQRPPSPEGRLVLAAMPANLPPARWPVTGQEALPELCDGALITAERLRLAAAAFTRQARWSAQATSLSWRRDALASAITAHSSELILRTLAQRAVGLHMGAAIQEHLHNAASAMRDVWTAWRAITDEWDLLSTGLDRGKGLSQVAAEADDLVLRIGRMAYRNPRWTPACGNASLTRDPADLAPAATDLPMVAAVVHRATDTITQIAIQDRQCVRQAFTEGRLYIATRLLPADYDIPYRYTPVPSSRAQPLLSGYNLAVKTCSAATAALDNLALATEAPSRVLAMARRLTPADQPPDGHLPGQRHPAQQPAAALRPCHVERTLHNLHISDPDLLLRAATIDEAARALTAEAIMRTRRCGTIADRAAPPAPGARHPPGPRSPRAPI